MATLEISEPMFAETIENNELVLLDFWAEWCGPCKAYGPVYERVSNDFPDVVFGKIDTEEQQAKGSRGQRLVRRLQQNNTVQTNHSSPIAMGGD